MAEQAHFIAALKKVGDQMTGLFTTMGAQGMAKINLSRETIKSIKNGLKVLRNIPS